MRNSSNRFSNSCEMDTKIEIKEEDPLSDDISSKIRREICTKVVIIKKNCDVVLVDDDYDMAIKTKIKLETTYPNISSQKEREYWSKHAVIHIKSETVTSSNCCDTDMQTKTEEETLVSDFGLRKKRYNLGDFPVMTVQKNSSNHELANKIEIKEEPWWLNRDISPVCGDIKDGDFSTVKSSRLCTKAVYGDSIDETPSHSADVLGRDASSCNGNHHPKYASKISGITEIATMEEHSHSQSDKCNDGADLCSSTLYLSQKKFMHKSERQHKCSICEKKFTRLSGLKIHNLIHEGKKPHQCKICDKSFTQLATLKMHNLIHVDKKQHHCEVCDKSFTHLSTLKTHNLIHEGKKPHQCKTCDKRFVRFAHLKMHNLIHEGKKPHQCKDCDKTFTQLSDLKRHNLIHEGRKPYQCKACDKNFTQLSHLKRHNLIHEIKKQNR